MWYKAKNFYTTRLEDQKEFKVIGDNEFGVLGLAVDGEKARLPERKRTFIYSKNSENKGTV